MALKDISTGGHNFLQPTSANAPTFALSARNGKPAIRWNNANSQAISNSDAALMAAINGGTDLTIWLYTKHTGGYGVFCNTSYTDQFIYAGVNNITKWKRGSADSGNIAIGNTNDLVNTVFRIDRTNNLMKIAVTGQTESVTSIASAYSGASPTFTLGGYGGYFFGDYALDETRRENVPARR